MKSRTILTLNGGSSSIKFAVFTADDPPQRQWAGKMERIGSPGTRIVTENGTTHCGLLHARAVPGYFLEWLRTQPEVGEVSAIGHRVVHGMQHSEPARVTPRLLKKLRQISPYDPEHMPQEIALIEAVAQSFRNLPQVACFDTAFHRAMPAVAKLLPLPRRYQRKGVERYGFHGLSYAYLLEELTRLDEAAGVGRVIFAHLGSGASLAAVRNGVCQDTTMGFTPAAGVMMGTRTGDLDPGVFYYLARTEQMTATQFQRMVNHESGLLGVSGTSSDIRDLCAREAKDPRAAAAVELFCYQVRKCIGAYAAALGGLETLVFSAGIGENSSEVRSRICEGLGFLGVVLDARRNERNAPVISKRGSRVTVRVMRTDEELMIAKSVSRMLKI